MQEVFVEKPYQFVPPFKQAWVGRMLIKCGLHRRLLRKREGVIDIELRNVDRLEKSVAAGHGVMVTPNHPRTSDPVVMCECIARTGIPFFTMASWHLFNQDRLTTWAIRALGAFSVNREGLDKASVDFAITALKKAQRPLLIFPEGTTSRTNDQLMALMEGPAFIARTAAKRRLKSDGGKVVVHPVAIRYLFQGDLERACDGVLGDIERQLTWRPAPEKTLIERMIKIGDALLRLKELQYDIYSDSAAPFKQRQNAMVNRLLDPLEDEWIGSRSRSGVAIRIKNLRMKIFPELSRNTLDTHERRRRWNQLEDTYLAQQIDCYPEQYVTAHPSVDRILETVEKFEEDLTDRCPIHGERKVIVDVGEAIEVSAQRDRSAKADPLIAEIQSSLETQLANLQGLSRMFKS